MLSSFFRLRLCLCSYLCFSFSSRLIVLMEVALVEEVGSFEEVGSLEEVGSSGKVSLLEAVGLLEEVGLSFTEVGSLLGSGGQGLAIRDGSGYAIKARFWVVPSRQVPLKKVLVCAVKDKCRQGGI